VAQEGKCQKSPYGITSRTWQKEENAQIPRTEELAVPGCDAKQTLTRVPGMKTYPAQQRIRLKPRYMPDI
jgi:hypothetical protein